MVGAKNRAEAAAGGDARGQGSGGGGDWDWEEGLRLARWPAAGALAWERTAGVRPTARMSGGSLVEGNPGAGADG